MEDVGGVAAVAPGDTAAFMDSPSPLPSSSFDPSTAATSAPSLSLSSSSPPFTWSWVCANAHLFLAFAQEGQALLHDALVTSWVAMVAWWRLIVLLGAPVVRLLLHLWARTLPYLRWFAKTFFNHLKEQKPEVLLGYALFVGAFVGFLLLRRLLRRLRVWDRCRAFVARKVAVVEQQYHKTRNKLHQYSRRAAEALPHVLFAVACLGTLWLFPDVVQLASQELVFHILLLYLPALATFYTLQSLPPTPPDTPSWATGKDDKRLKEWLSYWVVTALVFGAGGFLEQLWLRWVTRLVPWGSELVLFLTLWLHLPQGGAAMIWQHLVPFLRRNLGGLLALQEKRDAVVKSLLSVAVFTRLISQPSADRLANHVDEIFLVVPAAVLTFSPLAGWGLLFISLLYPAFATVRALGATGKYSPLPWLRYWVVYALSHLVLQVLPFWSALQMWYFLWVLLPHFDGVPFLPFHLDGRNRVFDVLSFIYHREQQKATSPKSLRFPRRPHPPALSSQHSSQEKEVVASSTGGRKKTNHSPPRSPPRSPRSPKRAPSSPAPKSPTNAATTTLRRRVGGGGGVESGEH